MTSRKRTAAVTAGITLIAAFALFGTAYALHLGPWQEKAEPPDLGPVIARMNGQPIYLADARSRIEGLTTVHGTVSEVLGENWPEVVFQSLVDDQILSQQARTLGIRVTDEDFQTWYMRIEGMIPSGQTLDEWLAAQNMTRADMDRTITRQIIGTRVYSAVTGDAKVTGKELRDYYRAHRADFTGTDGRVSSLLEVRRSIREQLLKEKRDEAYAIWLEQRRRDAQVTVLVDDWWKEV